MRLLLRWFVMVAILNCPLRRCRASAAVAHLSDYLQKYMQPNLDPCTDFHAFVCGKPPQAQIIPKVDKEIQEYTRFLFGLRGHVMSTLTSPSTNVTHAWLVKARSFYKNCMAHHSVTDTTTGGEPYSSDLPPSTSSAYVGGNFAKFIDILKELYANEVPLPTTLAGFRRILGFSFIFHVHSSGILQAGIDIEQSLFTLIDPNLYQQRNLLPSSYWTSRSRATRALYTSLMHRSQSIFDGLQLWPVDLGQVFELDQQVSSLIRLNDWSMNDSPSVQVFTLQDLETEYNNTFNWTLYFDAWTVHAKSKFWKAKAQKLAVQNFDHKFDPSSVAFGRRLLVKQPIYVQRVSMLLLNANRTVFLQYATLRFILFLEQNFYKRNEMYFDNSGSKLFQPSEMHWIRNLVGSEPHTRKKRKLQDVCTKITTDMFPAVNLINLDRHFVSNKTRRTVSDITQKIKNQFRLEMLEAGNRWGSAQTQFALSKLEQLQLHVTYPVEHLNEDKLDGLYDSLTLSANDDYMTAVLKYMTYFGSISVTSSHRLFSFPYYPFYQHMSNAAAVQPQLLQKPYLDADWPPFAIYGTIANSIAHEMAHAFDSQGWHFDSSGRFVADHLWPSQFTNLWKDQQQCLLRHYKFSHHPSPFPQGTLLTIPSARNLAENTADIMGIYLAYKTFVSVETNLEQTTDLGGKLYDRRQMFFISVARSLAYCTLDTEENLLTAALTDTHAPGRFRLIGLLTSNSLFADAFHCKNNTDMYPKNECRVFP